MDLALKDLRVLVTGSSSGIGAGIATVLAQEGAWVLVHGRDEVRAHAVAHRLRAAGARCSVALGDLSTDTGADAVAAVAEREMGGIDVLVNNAGGKSIAGNPGWFDVPLQAWTATYEQNVGAAVRMVHRLVPGMRECRFGRIIQVASASATQPEAAIGEYQAAKAAMINLTTGLARTLAHTGITVNTVSPGTIRTPAVDGWLGAVARQQGWTGDAQDIEQRFTREIIPLCVDRIGQPEDIGRVVALLASPLSGYITGANFRVDGGQVRSIN
jgi:NAD(P)-dependent dehydrogenase (short-subunit alcohol dehydrogenase family)